VLLMCVEPRSGWDPETGASHQTRNSCDKVGVQYTGSLLPKKKKMSFTHHHDYRDHHDHHATHCLHSSHASRGRNTHKPTPCSPPSRAQLQFATLSECVSECQLGIADNNACTTHTVHALAGNGRACASGEMGRDAQGNCLAAFGEAKQAYDFFAASCAAGGASQNEQCAAAAAAVLRLQPGPVDTTTAEYLRSCPDGRSACAGGGAGGGGGGGGTGCAEWCTRAGVPGGVPTCSVDGTRAEGVRGPFVSTLFANVTRDPASRLYDPAMAEIANHFDKECRGANNRVHHAHLSHNQGGSQDVGAVDPRAPIATQLEAIRRTQCMDAHGRRDYHCETSVDARANRELMELLAIRQLEASDRRSDHRDHREYHGDARQCHGDARHNLHDHRDNGDARHNPHDHRDDGDARHRQDFEDALDSRRSGSAPLPVFKPLSLADPASAPLRLGACVAAPATAPHPVSWTTRQ